MGLSEMTNFIIIVLLLVIIILQIIGHKKTDISEIISVLKRTAEEQRKEVQQQISNGATEQFERFGVIQQSIQGTLSENRKEVNRQLKEFEQQMESKLETIQNVGMKSNEQIGRNVTTALQDNRKEQNDQLHEFGEQVNNRLLFIQRANADNIEKINTTLENKVKELQESNEKRLEQMQGVVDEKLQKTLETRLSQSFELVSKQLESVGQGLGEMRALAADAKSLKNALINVKERGTYGEIRLEKLLSDILAPNQYETNVEIASGKRVEFAMVFSITHRCVNFIRASCYSI